jgi:hypothetical protein
LLIGARRFKQHNVPKQVQKIYFLVYLPNFLVVQSASFSSLSNLVAQEESFLKVAISNGGTIPRNPSSQNHHITKSMSLEHSYSHGAIADLHLDENENETNFNGRVTHSRSYMDGLHVKTSEDGEQRSNSPTLSCEFALLQMLCHNLLPKIGQKSI